MSTTTLSRSAARSARLALSEACRSVLESHTYAAAKCALETAAGPATRLKLAGMLSGKSEAEWQAARDFTASLSR